jgi:hypothetical protein
MTIDISSLSYTEKLQMAEDPNTSISDLRELAEDKSVDVRKEVAWNESSDVSIFSRLKNDKSSIVRGAVASNPDVPPKILLVLGKDYWDYVRRMVVTNKNLDIPTILALYAFYVAEGRKSSDQKITYKYLYRHPNTPKYLRAKMRTLQPWITSPDRRYHRK